jgi:hypothetical protein
MPSFFVVLRGLKVAERGYFRFYYTEAFLSISDAQEAGLVFPGWVKRDV